MKRVYNYKMSRNARRCSTIKSKYQKYVTEYLQSGLPTMYWECDNAREFDSARRALSRILYQMNIHEDVMVRCDYSDLVVGLEPYEP